MKPFFISTPIYYVNARPHLGHGYTTIVADSVNRFHRLKGDATFFLTGTDEHGDKIVQAAEAAGQDPKTYSDTISQLFKDLWPVLEVTNDQFIRTTDLKHKACVRSVLQTVFDKGDIYFDEYGGHYCFGCERFYTDKELVDGKCPDHQTVPTFIKEKNYFFRMSKYLEPLREHIEANPDFIQPERYRNEVLSMLKEDLGDLCISRPKTRLTWGIELPFDSDFVTYVWFDALINYISALGYPDGEDFRKYWPGAHHLVAKDILKPHAVFWPTMLMSAGIPLYKGLRVHGYWTVNETKMSKSIGNVVAPLDMAQKYGLSAFRYFLLSEMSFGQDSSFSEDALVGRFNADLANDLGNLFSRSLSMTHKYFGGVVPECGELLDLDREVLDLGHNAMANYQSQFEHFQFSRALKSLWELVRHLNKYIDSSAPWTLYKNKDMNRLGTVLYVILEGMRKVAVHLWPVMPSTSETMLAQLGVKFSVEGSDLESEISSWFGLAPGTPVAERSNLFPRQDLEQRDETAAEPKKAKPAKAPKPEAKIEMACPDCIEFEDFAKVDLRVGTVLEATPHPEADRLLVLKIDTAEETPRQVVAGIAEFFKPEELVGRQVVVVANLKPRKLRGLVSQGMVLAVKKEGGLALLGPSSEVANGGKVS
ncbi:MAG: methionine--tRNA ligase [Deltaproteobacteria bacterium HGW-Deltaproteobacteria-18]|nr:MAG: methionine--tRNA ligase [Deltaproteobacteria bacterium HGW-Deltaproteobacteria-18]